MKSRAKQNQGLSGISKGNALSSGGRKTIGLLVGQGTGSYDHGLYAGVRSAAAGRDINVVNLMCGSLDSTLWNPHECQNNLLFFLPSKGALDGLILIPSILYNYATRERFQEVLDAYRGIPLISISDPIPGNPGVFVNNVSGIRELVRHLHDRHGRRRFAFIAGPPINGDAIDRLRGFRQGVEDCALVFDPRQVFEGNFWWTGGKEGAQYFFGEGGSRPDALVCANDYTAFGVYEELRSLGVRIPEDVVVTGFDNDGDSRLINPPLTTIEQPLDIMANRAVEALCRMMDGAKVDNRIELPTRTLYRRSCGCRAEYAPRQSVEGWEHELGDDDLRDRLTSWVGATKAGARPDDEKGSALLDSLYDILFISIERGKGAFVRSLLPALLDSSPESEARDNAAFMEGAQAIFMEIKELEHGLEASKNSAFKHRELLAIQNIISVTTFDELFDRLTRELPVLGIRSFFLNVFPKPFDHGVKERWEIPEKARCAFAYYDGKVLELPRQDTTFRTKQLISPAIHFSDRQHSLIAMACFFMKAVYGYIVFESSLDDMLVLGNLATQVSAAYRSILVQQELKKSAKDLRQAMQKLE